MGVSGGVSIGLVVVTDCSSSVASIAVGSILSPSPDSLATLANDRVAMDGLAKDESATEGRKGKSISGPRDSLVVEPSGFTFST